MSLRDHQFHRALCTGDKARSSNFPAWISAGFGLGVTELRLPAGKPSSEDGLVARVDIR